MQWAFPEANGNYEVRLYFAETYGGTASVGARIFNVNVEGQVLNNFDIYAAAGNHANNAIVKRFNVALTDGTININFAHVKENPSIQAIEILSATPPPAVALFPNTPPFGSSVTDGQTATFT